MGGFVVVRAFKQYYVEFECNVSLPVIVAGVINRAVGGSCSQISLASIEVRKNDREFRLTFNDGMEIKIGYDSLRMKYWIHASLPYDHPADPKNIVEGIIKLIEEKQEEKKEGDS